MLKCKLGTTFHQFLMQITVETNSTLDAKLFQHFPDLIIFCEMVSRPKQRNGEKFASERKNDKRPKTQLDTFRWNRKPRSSEIC